MNYDAFISYSSHDKQIADIICSGLESSGIKCWIAPRDVVPGKEWARAIVEAIASSQTFVLVLSTHSNDSHDVLREVTRAANADIPIIPIRTDDVVLTESFDYYIADRHWLDARVRPFEQHLDRLIEIVKAELENEPISEESKEVYESEREEVRGPAEETEKADKEEAAVKPEEIPEQRVPEVPQEEAGGTKGPAEPEKPIPAEAGPGAIKPPAKRNVMKTKWFWAFTLILVASAIIIPIIVGQGGEDGPPSTYSLIIRTVGEGTVDRSPYKSTYSNGESVTLTPKPAEGWFFNEWSGDTTGSSSPRIINIKEDMDITAHFLEEEDERYGGILSVILSYEPTVWDSAVEVPGISVVAGTVYQQCLTNDWSRGPAGSGDTEWAAGAAVIEDYLAPQLAEDWEILGPGVWELTIRPGVYWQPVDSEAGKLMNEREVTASDIVYSFERLIESPSSWLNRSEKTVAQSINMVETDPWQVRITVQQDFLKAFSMVIQGSIYHHIYPREVVERYGDLTDWRNAVGTGPFMLDEYIPGSQVKFIKNPNYWETDPVGSGKGNQLPYIDQIKMLIVTDRSTRAAALRTGMIDYISGLERDEYIELKNQVTDLKYNRYLSNRPYIIAMRTDKNELPFYDVRVRRAMMLATDFEVIKDDLFDGDAEIDVYPVNKNFGEAFNPLTEMPASIQELYSYNPETAKQLLADVGYPNGFRTNIVCTIPDVDYLSIIKDMWAQVDIDLEIDVMESGAYYSILRNRTHDEMIYCTNSSTFPSIFYFSSLRGSSTDNPSFINDPIGSDPEVEKVFQAMEDVVFTDNQKMYELFKDLQQYLKDQAYVIPCPTPYTYSVWWPWLKNYFGSGRIEFARFWWIDRELKEKMGY